MTKSLTVLLITLVAALSVNSLPAFPGAEGWGADTPGGRGGRVLIVTNLNPVGTGSLRAALQQSGPRMILFRVSGVIDLSPSDWDITKDMSNVTIAGQTSPGGITLTGSANNGQAIWRYMGSSPLTNDDDYFHDAIFRFLRFRCGSHNNDCVTLTHSRNYIMDHCDLSGATDETQDQGYSKYFTIQWCTISNASDGQAYGSLIAYAPNSYISMHHNLWANLQGRGGPAMHWSNGTPLDNGNIDYRNNVCYNVAIYMLKASAPSPVHFNLVSNVFKAGPATPYISNKVQIEGECVAYETDNAMISHDSSISYTAIKEHVDNTSPTEYDMAPVTTWPAMASYDSVLNKVGAWPRDSMNRRTINDVRNGTGELRKDDDPKITDGPEPPADTDMDGMPDAWETAMGFNPDDYNDHDGDHDNDGYTNVEEYINDLAFILLGEEPHNQVAVETFKGRAAQGDHIKISPNPVSVRAGISIRLNAAGNNSRRPGLVKIYDMNGKNLRSFFAQHTIKWNGCDRTGRKLPSGMYLVKWISNTNTITIKRMIIL